MVDIDKQWIIEFNIFNHFIDIFRIPFLNQGYPINSLLIVVLFTTIMFFYHFCFFVNLKKLIFGCNLTLIEIKNLVINYPVYSNLKRSFKRKIIDFALAGNITNKDNTTYVNAVNDISFTVNKGDKIGLIGSNGSGKTSLLRAIMGIYEPFSGHVICKETTTSLIDIELGIDEDATGYENIFTSLILNISKKNKRNFTRN